MQKDVKETLKKVLTPQEFHVLCEKGTERAHTGEYCDSFESKGFWCCRACFSELFEPSSKYKTECGWPSFKASKDKAVLRTLDADGERIEITCADCKSHLGHVFIGERQTETNTRYCVNSLALKYFASDEDRKNAREKRFLKKN
jgi:methionine-R-sulfoxide reductase